MHRHEELTPEVVCYIFVIGCRRFLAVTTTSYCIALQKPDLLPWTPVIRELH